MITTMVPVIVGTGDNDITIELTGIVGSVLTLAASHMGGFKERNSQRASHGG